MVAAACLFLYLPGGYSFAVFVLAVLMLAPTSLSSTTSFMRRKAFMALHWLMRSARLAEHDPPMRIRVGLGLIVVLLLAAYFSIGSWLVFEAAAVVDLVTYPQAQNMFFAGTIFVASLLIGKGKYGAGKPIFLMGLLWMVTHKSITLFLNRIGVDSFAEAKNFDVVEARFWLSTIDEAVSVHLDVRALVVCALTSLIVFFWLKQLLEKSSYSTTRAEYCLLFVAALLMGGGIYLTVSDSLRMFFKSSISFLELRANFSAAPVALRSDGKTMNVVVYIGESTTAMNLGLYGYPRNTTPKLDHFANNNAGLLVFKNVFSTHTHTSPSLLEALSFGVNGEQKYLPIQERQRVSVVDVVRRLATVDLYSNQGATGTYNQASSVIFKHARRVFSAETRLLGNSEGKLQRPMEHEFFKQVDLAANTGKRLTFLHSYAGHGPYLTHIPLSFHDPVDQSLDRYDAAAVLGKSGALAQVEHYDSAIRYIDFSVSKLFQSVKNSSKPAVVIYFSDHGESVYTNRGHDSARFTHEMIRIPFLVYFNDAAKKTYPRKYRRYLALSRAANPATLAQLPSTILDLVGLELAEDGSGAIIDKPLIGEPTRHDPIIVRRTAKGLTYVNLNVERDRASAGLDVTDGATSMFKARVRLGTSGTKLCYGRTDSLAKAMRGGLLSDCLQMSAFMPQDQVQSSGILSYAIKNNLSLWTEATVGCSRVAGFLTGQHRKAGPVLVEFADADIAPLRECAGALKQALHAVAYRVASDDALACADALRGGEQMNQDASCIKLRRDVENAHRSDIFTDLSFHHDALEAIERIEVAKHLRWNVSGVAIQNLPRLAVDRFRMIALDNADPNSQ